MSVYIIILVVSIFVGIIVQQINSATQYKLNPDRIIVSRKASRMSGNDRDLISLRLDPPLVDDGLDPFLMYLIYECWADQNNLEGYLIDNVLYLDEDYVNGIGIREGKNGFEFDIEDYCDESCEVLN